MRLDAVHWATLAQALTEISGCSRKTPHSDPHSIENDPLLPNLLTAVPLLRSRSSAALSMSNKRLVYRAIKQAVKQLYATEPQGRFAWPAT